MLDAAKTETLLEVNNIEVIYNHVILVLKGVSLSVPKGGITALLGGNGAGKTTTLRAVSNLLKYLLRRFEKATLGVLLGLLVGAVVLVPIILAYTAHAYWVFRGKVDAKTGYH